MDRPYIICHMVTSLDGKVTREFLGKSAYSGLIEDYYRIHREYKADGFLCGRVTIESSDFLFKTLGLKSTLTEIGIDDTNFKVMAKKAYGGDVLQGFKLLTAEDVENIYRMCL